MISNGIVIIYLFASTGRIVADVSECGWPNDIAWAPLPPPSPTHHIAGRRPASLQPLSSDGAVFALGTRVAPRPRRQRVVALWTPAPRPPAAGPPAGPDPRQRVVTLWTPGLQAGVLEAAHLPVAQVPESSWQLTCGVRVRMGWDHAMEEIGRLHIAALRNTRLSLGTSGLKLPARWGLRSFRSGFACRIWP